jgi:hypothetical protein
LIPCTNFKELTDFAFALQVPHQPATFESVLKQYVRFIFPTFGLNCSSGTRITSSGFFGNLLARSLEASALAFLSLKIVYKLFILKNIWFSPLVFPHIN